MIARVQFQIDARRSRDTDALAHELERLFRQHTVGTDGNLDLVSVNAHTRGGTIALWATVEGDRENVQARVRAIGEHVDGNRNLIDRIDELVVAAHEGSSAVSFYRGDYRGWLRQIAIDDAAAAAQS